MRRFCFRQVAHRSTDAKKIPYSTSCRARLSSSSKVRLLSSNQEVMKVAILSTCYEKHIQYLYKTNNYIKALDHEAELLELLKLSASHFPFWIQNHECSIPENRIEVLAKSQPQKVQPKVQIILTALYEKSWTFGI